MPETVCHELTLQAAGLRIFMARCDIKQLAVGIDFCNPAATVELDL
jgi:hypothetical protein